MDVALTIIVGFGGAIVGAAAGFLGAVYIERQRVQRSRAGMLRALISELGQNAMAMFQGIRRGGTPVLEFSSDTWESARFPLSEFLSAEIYDHIQFLYVSLPSIRTFFSQLRGAAELDEKKEMLIKWANRALTTRSKLRHLPEMNRFQDEQNEVEISIEAERKQVSSAGNDN